MKVVAVAAAGVAGVLVAGSVLLGCPSQLGSKKMSIKVSMLSILERRKERRGPLCL